ncbi:MAG: T9SS type A sorting domain-containing protein [FCB group bacterium]|nr:T9SS type A sorting domain-containing protein [FCB group bacterium]
MNKKNVVALVLTVFFFGFIKGQSVDTLDLNWEPSVHFGTYGQRTVVVNDTLWHFGGLLRYGIPFGYDYEDYSFMEYKAPDNGYWRVDTTKIIFRRYFNAESYNGKIYIFGGIGSEQYTQYLVEDVEIFDPSTGTITYGTPLPYPRRAGGSAVYNGKIYLVGGESSTGYSDRLDIYDINTNTWTSGASLPIATETEAVYYDGKIYVIGGYDGGVHDEVFEYDINADTWTQIGVAPSSVSAHKMAAYNGLIFVIGDYGVLDRLWVYNIADGSWTEYSSNIIGRRHTSLAISGDKLYIIAGNSKLDGVYQYYRVVQSIDLSPFLSVSGQSDFLPKAFELDQNYPNPFNPVTNIDFTLHQDGDVKLKVYDLLGKQVQELYNGFKKSGSHTIQWNGKTQNGEFASSGEYIVVIEMNGNILTKKMILIK